MSRVAIFTDDPGWHGKQLKLALANHGFIAEYVSLTECRLQIGQGDFSSVQIPGFENALPAAAFVRGVPGGSLEEVVLYLDILHALKLLGTPVYNDGRAVERSVDKAMTSFLLNRAGLLTPETWVLKDRSEAVKIAERLLKSGNRVISKPLFGSQGEGIRRFEKMTDLFWLTDNAGVFYLQKFVRSRGLGYSDMRVFVINGRAIAAMRRMGRFWLNNVARGADCEPVRLSGEVAKMAVEATRILDMDYAGVDIMQDEKGRHMVIEVNSIPAWKGLQSVCQLNVAELLVADLIKRYINTDDVNKSKVI